MSRDAEIIDGALEVLGPNGERWTQKQYWGLKDDGTDEFCLLGALAVAENVGSYEQWAEEPWEGDPDFINDWFDSVSRTPEALREAIKEVFGYSICVTEFNDHDERTFDDVREVLEKARAKATEL